MNLHQGMASQVSLQQFNLFIDICTFQLTKTLVIFMVPATLLVLMEAELRWVFSIESLWGMCYDAVIKRLDTSCINDLGI